MTCGTIFTEIHIELIVFCFQSQLIHTCFQLIVIILSLASTNDLTDSRYQTVHGSNCLAILVLFHVECLDLLRIICHKYRFLEDFFCQITLMLCLKVASPEYFVIEFVIVFLQKFNCFCISHMTKLRIHYMVQAIQKSFVDKGIEEVHLLRSILQHITDHVFQHVLCKIHIVIQIGKCTFRLDHPELSSMTRCIGVLRTESRSECINITECLCISLTVQLTTYCKISLFAEEILTVIYSTVFIQRRILHIQCSNLEHLSRTLAVTSCDQRCVYTKPLSWKNLWIAYAQRERTRNTAWKVFVLGLKCVMVLRYSRV